MLEIKPTAPPPMSLELASVGDTILKLSIPTFSTLNRLVLIVDPATPPVDPTPLKNT